jgi:undecaprenyl-diphosphatase
MRSRTSARAELPLRRAVSRRAKRRLSPRGAAGPPKLSLRQALLLGALHGPAELLPISSSGHLTAIPWLLGWRYDELDGEVRKSFEVALHAGSAAALLIALRDEVVEPLRALEEAVAALDRRRLAVVALSSAPPALAGYAFERPIARRLGTPQTVAVGLLAGAAAMVLADRAPQDRSCDDAGPRDGLWLGAAQALALVPGVSRNGATLAAARLLGFTRADANRLSRHAALPVIAGAAALRAGGVRRDVMASQTRAAFAAGAAAAFVSTLASTRLIRRVERDRSLLPYAVYRAALAALMIWRLPAGDPPTLPRPRWLRSPRRVCL